MDNLIKNAKELHYDHRSWLSNLAEIRIELIALAKHNHNGIKKDIGSLLKTTSNLEKEIRKHENTIALAFKTCGVDDHTEIFPDHDDIRQKVDSLRFKLENLKAIFLKYNNLRTAT